MSLQVDIRIKLKNNPFHIKFDTSSKCFGILGASGSGKSVTLKAIAGITVPDSGIIVYNGRTLFDSEKRINLPPQKRNVGYLFQKYALFPNMSVYRNITAAMGKMDREKEDRVDSLLKQFHIEKLRDNYPSYLSGGEQQRVALARMLASKPSLLLFDEPFSALDSYLRDELQVELDRFLSGYNGQAVLVSHDRDEVYRLCGETAVMSEGSILVKKETKELFNNPERVQAARISGCKNIVQVRKIGEHTVEVEDWNVTLTTKEAVGEHIKSVGIRAHSFFEVTREEYSHKAKTDNFIPVGQVKVIETPFEQNLLIDVTGGRKEIWWKKAIEYDNNRRENTIEYIGVLPEDVLLLEN